MCASRIGLAPIAFTRSEILGVRDFVSRALGDGHGEWEAEVNYTQTKDSASGYDCSTCCGSSQGGILQLAGLDTSTTA